MVVLSILTLSSCASFSNNENDAVYVSLERERAAIELLALDMFSSMSSFSFDPEILSPSLPQSFSYYEEYVPSYNELKENYLSAVTTVSLKALKDYIPVIKERALEMSASPLSYVTGDTSFTEELRKQMEDDLSSVILKELGESSEYLDESFLAVYRVFEEIRKGYESLETVGKGEYLPLAERIILDDASRIVSAEFFDQLGKKEKVLKNTPAPSSSPYAVFWE